MSEAPEKKAAAKPAQPEQTAADFIRLVKLSGLVEQDALEKTIAPWATMTGPLPAELPAALVAADLLTEWQIEQIRKGKHKGFMLGKYKLLRLLGAGGMSSVYLAENPTLRQLVAIKVLPVKRVEQSSYLARFEREAQTAARLSHHNITRAFDLDTAGAIHFFVMEYVEGVDLHAKVKAEGPLSIRDTADFIRQAAVGLHYAHEEGLVHRDIKPANLMLDKKGAIKILDLGLALGDDDEEASLTREHDEKVLGTADYLAPEQARDSHLADRRSDVYSLGCTLFYLLVGNAPFAKGSLGERVRAHMNEPPPNVLELRSDVPTEIAELYFRMMAKDPNGRPQTAQEVADALDVWLKSTSGARQQELPEPPRRSLRRSPGEKTGGIDLRRLQPPGPVVRSGPGSSSGGLGSGGVGAGRAPRRGGSDAVRRTPGSDVDLSSLSFPAAPSSGSRSTAKMPNVGPAVAPKPPATAKPAAAAKPTKAAGPSRRFGGVGTAMRGLFEKQVAGLPIGFWLVVVIALIAAAGLAAKVYSNLK
jgi:eukaryotic-like serine/threonine-protein kinase